MTDKLIERLRRASEPTLPPMRSIEVWDLCEEAAHQLELQARENGQLRAALEEIYAVMGPDVPKSMECDGCRYEWGRALRVAKAVLAIPPALRDDHE